jgi:tripartite-type tricarboxylate transporter receptor subunit TctC
MQAVAGIRMTHVPYAGPAQALNDLIAGRMDIMFDFPLTSLPHVREGRLRALGLTTEARLPLAPGIPPLGLPGVEMLSWAGLFVPARTPPEAVAVLEAAAGAALRDAAVQDFFEGTGTLIWADTGAEALGRFLDAEIPRARELVRRAGLLRTG